MAKRKKASKKKSSTKKKAGKKKSVKKKAAAGKPAVKIYTTPTCPWCKKTKEFFKAHKVKYKELDVVSNEKARSDMITKSGQMGVPVIEVGKTIIVGFDESGLKKALKIK